MPTYRRHAADMNLELLSGIGITPVGEDDRIPRLDRVVIESEAAWKDKLDGEVVGIHPGAGWPLRKWYPDKFARVADQVAERTGRRIAVIGSVSDEPMVRQIIKGMSGPAESIICHNLRQLAGAMSALRLLICNDSGPMHLAGALGVPMVVVWGPGDYEQYSPRGSKAIVIRHQPLCAPCCQEGAPTRCGMGHAWPNVACLTPITPQEVVDAACRLLET
jgi:heptosyltransferase-2